MQFLPVGVAAVINFGPFVDKADGVTLKTDATTITDIDHATTGIFLSKNGANAAIRHQNVTASVADDYGMMTITLDTTDTNTVGTLDVLFAKAATYLPVHKSFMVLPVQVYNSIVAGTDLLDISEAQLAGTAITAQMLAAWVKFFDKASPTGTINSLPDAVAGANGGLPTTNGTKMSQTVDLTSGQTIAANLTQILTTGLTETVGGYLSAAFKKLFDVATPVLTAASVNQGADNNVILASASKGLVKVYDDMAKDSTVSKPGTAQTITAPADMALNSTCAKEATCSPAGFFNSTGAVVVTVDNGVFAPNLTTFEVTGITDATANAYADCWVKVLTGANAGEAKRIGASSVVVANVRLVVDTMSAALGNGDTLLLF